MKHEMSKSSGYSSYNRSTPSSHALSKECMRRIGKPRLLIANKNCFLLNSLRSQLEESFSVIDLADNGLEAYDLVKRKGRSYYSAIILDIDMPIMGGCEACIKIHSFINEGDFIKSMQVKMGPNERRIA